MRILNVITGLNTGGAEAMLCRLSKAMEEFGVSSSTVSLLEPGALASEMETAGISVESLGMRRGIPSPSALVKLGRIMQREKSDVILSWLYHADLIALIANRLSGHLPLVWNLRCSYMDFAAYPRTTAMTVRTCAKLSALPDAVIANSAEALQSHRRLGYRPRKTAVIPNGFDTMRFRPDSDAAARLRSLVGADEGDCIVGMVGRYDHMKDHATFLKAAAHALGRWPSLRFVLCGEGVDWDNDELASMIRRHGIANRVWLLGRQRDMPPFMAGLDMLVLSSRGESFPNVLGEAMSCAVPCITTDVGAAARIVADTGFVCRVGDAECLSRSMLRLVSYVAAERKRIGRRARKRVQEHYDISAVAARYVAFLNSVRK